MNQKIPCSQRILAFFLAMFMLCSLSLPVLAEAAPSETPTPTPTTSVPQTGDGFQPILWLALIAISGGALAVLIMRKRKNGDSGDNDHISG